MQIRINPIPSDRLDGWRKTLLRFAGRYGDRRIAAESLRWLADAAPEDLEDEGTAILLALDGRRIAGFSCASRYGQRTAFAVVRPEYRGQRVGSTLLRELIGRLGRLECVVACDNVPSMAMCFHAGMHAIGLTRGATGKPALRFSGECRSALSRPFRHDDSASPKYGFEVTMQSR